MEQKHSDFNYSEIFASEPTQSVHSQPVSVCKCLLSAESLQEEGISERKKRILSTANRAEIYMRDHRIPELVRFLLAKIIARSPSELSVYLANLLDQCMMYRAGHGTAPVLYENRHLEAVVKSFDPGERGWLSAGQVRRAFTTLGLTPEDDLDERISTDIVLNKLRITQERELFRLLAAGSVMGESDFQSTSSV